MILVDTSVWITVFRNPRPFDVESLGPFVEIVVCLPVIQEVLQGFRDEARFRQAYDLMTSLPVVESPLRRDVFDLAVDLYRTAGARGLTIRSSVDCLIAACAIRNDLEVVHVDRDFRALSRVSRLKERPIRA